MAFSLRGLFFFWYAWQHNPKNPQQETEQEMRGNMRGYANEVSYAPPTIFRFSFSLLCLLDFFLQHETGCRMVKPVFVFLSLRLRESGR